MEETILRYVLVNFGFESSSWYIDESDSAEVQDFVLVPYGIEEKTGAVVNVVRCIPPYTPYPQEKTKYIFEITERRGTPKT